MKKILYPIAVLFVSILFDGCESHEVWESIFVTNDSSYDVYIYVSAYDGGITDDLGEIESGEENKELFNFMEFDGTDRLNGYIEFYHKRTEAQQQIEMAKDDASLFIRKIDEANSIVEVLSDTRMSYGIKGYIHFRIVVTNEMLGLPPLTGGA
jgi:hypothetical protein